MPKGTIHSHRERSLASARAGTLGACPLGIVAGDAAFSLRTLPCRAGLVVLLLGALLAGCAVPGEPLPPLLEIPAPITTLSARQEGGTLMVSVPVPHLTTEGTRPRQLERIELYQEFTVAAASQPEFTHHAVRVWTGDELAGGKGEVNFGQPVEPAHIGQRVWLAARARNRRGVDAGLSNVTSVLISNLPLPPSDLAATVTEHAVLLHWKASPASAIRDAAGPLSPIQYEIFRASADADSPLTAIAQTGDTSYSDTTISLGSSYRYAVRSVAGDADASAATPLSAIIEVQARDQFPPAAPANLRAIAVTGAVELAWSPNSEPDLAGYNVYREQLNDRGEPVSRQKLNPTPLDIPLFRDSAARPASRYRYQITALDRDGNESGPSNEELVETE